MRLSLHPTPTRIRAYGRRGHNAARRSLLQCRASTATDELRLQQLLRWLTANGAKGFGDPDDPNTKVGVFLQDTNNRGLIATKDVKAGQVIFQVPVALGVVDDGGGRSERVSGCVGEMITTERQNDRTTERTVEK